jgi:hypothetical protein
MTRITCTCPNCGTVALQLDELLVVVDPRTGGGRYVFDCYGCARQVITEVPDTVIEAMGRLHIPLEFVPAEILENGSVPRPARPIGFDDLLDLLLWLQAHDDLAAGGTRNGGPLR